MSELSCGTRFIGRNETLDQIRNLRVRVKIFLGPYDSLFDSEGVFRRPERWGFGKYGHCQIGYRRKKIDVFHPVF